MRSVYTSVADIRQLCITFVCKPSDVYSTNVKSRCAETNVATIYKKRHHYARYAISLRLMHIPDHLCKIMQYQQWYQAGMKQLWRLSVV